MSHPPAEPEVSVHRVPTELAGRRLDQAVTELITDLSRAAAQRLIGEGFCLVNGQRRKPSAKVRAGDEVSVTIPPPELTELVPEDIPLEVVYEGPDLIVINKPSGMVVHPAAGHPSGTLVNALMAHCSDLSGIGGELRPGIVHRLDKETSGLLVAAKHDVSHRHLAAQIEAHTARRTYWALVWGLPSPDSGQISAPIARHPQHRQMMGVVAGGREAVTRYRVLETFRLGAQREGKARSVSLVELNLQTGRTHQIRVHMTHLGHPVLGDPLYGRQRPLPKGTAPEVLAAVEGLLGQALHARRLSFTHPSSGDELTFEAEPPEDFRRLLEALRATGRTDE